jgi:hypothetical protein
VEQQIPRAAKKNNSLWLVFAAARGMTVLMNNPSV